MYIIVSEEPIRIDAQRPAKLSGPNSLNRLFIIAVDALPEMGRIIITGIISIGIPIFSVKAPRVLQIRPSAPLAEIIFVAQIRIIRLGSILNEVLIPSLHPVKNSLNKSLFVKINNPPAIATSVGIE